MVLCAKKCCCYVFSSSSSATPKAIELEIARRKALEAGGFSSSSSNSNSNSSTSSSSSNSNIQEDEQHNMMMQHAIIESKVQAEYAKYRELLPTAAAEYPESLLKLRWARDNFYQIKERFAQKSTYSIMHNRTLENTIQTKAITTTTTNSSSKHTSISSKSKQAPSPVQASVVPDAGSAGYLASCCLVLLGVAWFCLWCLLVLLGCACGVFGFAWCSLCFVLVAASNTIASLTAATLNITCPSLLPSPLSSMLPP